MFTHCYYSIKGDIMRLRRFFVVLLLCTLCLSSAWPQPDMGRRKVPYRVPPSCETIPGISGEYRGHLHDRLEAITEGWLIPAPIANPMMIDMFITRECERDPVSHEWFSQIGNLLPWSGEFVGKHLLSDQLVCRMTHDPKLKMSIDKLVRQLVATQGDDGYLGPFDKSKRFYNDPSSWKCTWDYWGHYHIMLALLMYYEDTGWEPALSAVCRAADLIGDTLLERDPILFETNNAIIHGMVKLYLVTGEPRYLEIARWVEAMWDRPNSLQYIKLAVAGKPVVEFPAHRWESAHSWQGIAEMYLVTGDETYRKAFSHIWWDALHGDRHNTGGWTSGEGIQNNPYHPGAIETCCTVAWIALSVDMLRLTGNSLIADELELSTWNGSIGGMHPSGRWWTYNTPMDGAKRSSMHDITFQQRAGSPELNCCSVNAPRGLGMIQNWAVMKTDDGYALNWYGPCTFTIPLESGKSLIIDQRTEYPDDGRVVITFGIEESLKTTLKIRIPSWSAKTAVLLNGQPVGNAVPGTYMELSREWRDGDSLLLTLDMTPHFWVGERECAGKTSVYKGPILLAWDKRFNEGKTADIPVLDARNPNCVPVVVMDFPQPICAYRVQATDGSSVVLCDFATAGMTGTLYRSWLPVEGILPTPESPGKPVWTAR
jgi:uncharacterized protein